MNVLMTLSKPGSVPDALYRRQLRDQACTMKPGGDAALPWSSHPARMSVKRRKQAVFYKSL